MARLVLCLHFFIFKCIFVQCSVNEIDLPQGKIKGLRSYTDNYLTFLGIPYASVVERFQEPGPPPKWNKTFNATSSSVICKQVDSTTHLPSGEEDCLVLNVFSPVTSDSSRLPVLIFIHGGGFYYGSNTDLKYHPKYLVKKGIIVVTINYRLGAFGFLCLQTPKAPGNAGLKDQVAALRWVKSNIEYFGGDPFSITLYGQSVGAASINYLLWSVETEGLFQNVIIASGSLLVPYAFDNDPLGTASRIARRMGYTIDDADELLQVYQNASADNILKASNFDDKNDPLAPYVFRPCIDESEGSLVRSGPREIIKLTSLNRNVTIVVGYNDKEGIRWAEKFDSIGLQKLNSNFSAIIPDNIIFANENEKSTFIAEVKEFYFQNETIGRNSYDSLIDYISDSIIAYPLTAMTRYFLRANVAVYNYYFQYDSNRNLIKKSTSLASKPGSSHGDDLFYVFDPITYRTLPPTPNDATVIDAMTSFWYNLARTGDPATSKIQWFKSEQSDPEFLSIDKKIEMIPLPNKERLLFWKAIYQKYKSY